MLKSVGYKLESYTLQELKTKISVIWSTILIHADTNSLVYFFMVLPIDSGRLREGLKNFRPVNSVDQVVKMYALLKKEFRHGIFPSDIEGLLAIWKDSDIFTNPSTSYKNLILHLEIDLFPLVSSFEPQSDDDYWFLTYHLRQKGLLDFCYENDSVETAFNLVSLGFNLNQLADFSGSLSTKRLMEIFLKVGEPINDEELSAIERIGFYSEILRLKNLQPKDVIERLLGHPVPSTGLRMKEVLREPLGAEYLSQLSGGGVKIDRPHE